MRVLLLLAAIVAGLALGQLEVDCGFTKACQPWRVVEGPRCARGNRINIRFMASTAPERTNCTNVLDNGLGVDQRYVAYGFCPNVDELQAFNLSLAGRLMGTFDTATNVSLSKVAGTYEYEGFLRLYGFGTQENIIFPNVSTSEGAVQVVAPCPTDPTQIAIAQFLVLNITMKSGHFQYYQDYPQAAGVGFSPTCTTGSGTEFCTLDTTMPCIGPPGRRNCAFCYSDPTAVASVSVQVWTSYYGTDANGRTLTSGSNNPLNFRAYSGGGFYSSLSNNFGKISTGNFGQDPGNTGGP